MEIAIPFLITLSIIGLLFLMMWLTCRTKYKIFENPRSFESEFSLLEEDHYTFFVRRVNNCLSKIY